MRFAVIGDIRGNLPALTAALAAIEDEDSRVDRVVCAGDIVGRGPHPNEVIALLREREIESVTGNYDDAVAFDRSHSGCDFPDAAAEKADQAALQWTRSVLAPEHMQYLRTLPHQLSLSPGAGGVSVKRNYDDSRTAAYRQGFLARTLFGGFARQPASVAKQVTIVHGSTRALNEFIRPDTASSILAAVAREAQTDVLVSGHAATAFRRDTDGVTFVGVGPIDGPGIAAYAFLSVSRDVDIAFRTASFDLTAYRREVRASGLPEAIAGTASS